MVRFETTLVLLFTTLLWSCTVAPTDAKLDGAVPAGKRVTAVENSSIVSANQTPPAAGRGDFSAIPPETAPAATLANDPAASLYAAEPAPLTPVQCGQCHTGPYRQLRRDGGKHRFFCQDCHQTLHAYNPLKNNYAELMPQCSQCHEQVHGEKQVNCLSCHKPHAPARTPELAGVETVCADCHVQPARQLADFPSRHTAQKCTACHHDRHGYVPSCFECHAPHFAEQPLAECQTCHPVHQPLQIAFTPETQAPICRDCHSGVVEKWTGTASRHGQVNCTLCHVRHGQLPQCTECHSAPHPPEQMAMFPRCLDCHLDVHDLPVKKKK